MQSYAIAAIVANRKWKEQRRVWVVDEPDQTEVVSPDQGLG